MNILRSLLINNILNNSENCNNNCVNNCNNNCVNNNINIKVKTKCFPYSIFAGYIIWKAYNKPYIEIVSSYINGEKITSKDINDLYKSNNIYLNNFYKNFVKLIKKFNYNYDNIIKFIYYNKFENNYKLYNVPLYIYRGIIDKINILSFDDLKNIISKIKNIEKL